MDIPSFIRSLRGELTQEEFALRLNCHRQSIVGWETGRFIPSKEMLAKLGIKVTYEKDLA